MNPPQIYMCSPSWTLLPPGKIWENGIETCKISCMKRVASPGSMHDTGCLGLVHWDDPEKFLLKDTFIFIEAVYVHQYNFITRLFLVSDLFFHFSTCSIICIPRLYLYFSINPKCLHQYLIQDHILHIVVVYLNLSHTWSFLANVDFFFFF